MYTSSIYLCDKIDCRPRRMKLIFLSQHFLRLQAFHQLYTVLDIDPPPSSSKFRGGRYGPGGRFKRRREDNGNVDGSAKKEKKDGEEQVNDSIEPSGLSENTGGTTDSATSEKPLEQKC